MPNLKKIILAIMLLSMSLFADFQTIGVEVFKELQKEGLVVIDIRTEGEWQNTGIIEGAHKITFFSDKGQPLLADWFFEVGHLLKDKETPFIIYCAYASRTKLLAQGLMQMGFVNVYELQNGIEEGWIRFGEKVVKE